MKLIKILFATVGTIVGLLLIVMLTGYLLGGAAVAERTLSLSPLNPVPDPASMAERGQQLAGAYGCISCHGEQFGGTQAWEIPPPIATVVPPSLRHHDQLSDDAWDRAVRHGVGSDDVALIMMPSESFVAMPDVDLAAIIAWARTLPSMPQGEPTHLGGVGRILAGLGMFPLPANLIAEQPVPRRTSPAASVEYGETLAMVCGSCHGTELAGMPLTENGPPAGPDIRRSQGLSEWTYDDFRHFFDSGERPDGTSVDNEKMPWRSIGMGLDPERSMALWMYLETL